MQAEHGVVEQDVHVPPTPVSINAHAVRRASSCGEGGKGGGARKRGRASDGGECHTWCFDPGKATLLGWSARSPTVGRLKWRAFRGRRESVHERGGGRPSGGAGIGHAVQIIIILLEQGRGRLESVHERGGEE